MLEIKLKGNGKSFGQLLVEKIVDTFLMLSATKFKFLLFVVITSYSIHYTKLYDKLIAVIEEIKSEFQKEQTEFENQEQKINNKYNQILKKLNQEVLQTKTLITQTEVKYSQTELKISNLQKDAEKKKIEELSKIEPLIKEVLLNIGKSRQKYQDIKSEKEKKVKEKQEEQKQETNKLKSHFDNLEQKLDAQIVEEKP